jgi:hypothetical protein
LTILNASDRADAIASRLQKLTKTDYRVMNCSNIIGKNDNTYNQVFRLIQSMTFNENDIVIIIWNYNWHPVRTNFNAFEPWVLAEQYKVIDALPLFKEKNRDDYRLMPFLLTEKGAQKVAELLFKTIQENSMPDKAIGKPDKIETPPESTITKIETIAAPLEEKPLAVNLIEEQANKPKINQAEKANLNEKKKEIADYKSLLLKTRDEVIGKTGAVVSRSDPFTLGHRFLIDSALKEVSFLYLFIIEQDNSILPFADRFALVKAETKDLKNVVALPGGKFFMKPHNSVQDIALFAEEIAPVFNITVWFAGKESPDTVTGQYNDAMRRILSEHGVEFREIPRKESNGAAISASTARTLFKQGDFKGIAKIVPKTTLKYLKEKRDTFYPKTVIISPQGGQVLKGAEAIRRLFFQKLTGK